MSYDLCNRMTEIQRSMDISIKKQFIEPRAARNIAWALLYLNLAVVMLAGVGQKTRADGAAGLTRGGRPVSGRRLKSRTTPARAGFLYALTRRGSAHIDLP